MKTLAQLDEAIEDLERQVKALKKERARIRITEANRRIEVRVKRSIAMAASWQNQDTRAARQQSMREYWSKRRGKLRRVADDPMEVALFGKR